jgi:hypothetical protein
MVNLFRLKAVRTTGFSTKYLDEFNTMDSYPKWWLVYVKYDPLFDIIRNEERFQKILRNMEAKYQAEHERVRKWLREQEMH